MSEKGTDERIQRATALISGRLRLIRLSKRMTQHQLANASGISRTTIADIERGARPVIETDTLEALARALEIPPGDLVSPNRASTKNDGLLEAARQNVDPSPRTAEDLRKRLTFHFSRGLTADEFIKEREPGDAHKELVKELEAKGEDTSDLLRTVSPEVRRALIEVEQEWGPLSYYSWLHVLDCIKTGTRAVPPEIYLEEFLASPLAIAANLIPLEIEWLRKVERHLRWPRRIPTPESFFFLIQAFRCTAPLYPKDDFRPIPR